MARQVTIRAFEEWIKDEANVAAVLERIAGGMTLRNAAMAVKQPYTCLHKFFHETPEMEARYTAARKSWADAVQDEAVKLADECPADKDSVAKVKLQVEVRHNQAKAYNRDRWGERLQVDRNVKVTADAGLIGFASELLLQKSKRVPVTIENAPGQAPDSHVGTDSPSVTLPAPAVRE